MGTPERKENEDREAVASRDRDYVCLRFAGGLDAGTGDDFDAGFAFGTEAGFGGDLAAALDAGFGSGFGDGFGDGFGADLAVDLGVDFGAAFGADFDADFTVIPAPAFDTGFGTALALRFGGPASSAARYALRHQSNSAPASSSTSAGVS